MNWYQPQLQWKPAVPVGLNNKWKLGIVKYLQATVRSIGWLVTAPRGFAPKHLYSPAIFRFIAGKYSEPFANINRRDVFCTATLSWVHDTSGAGMPSTIQCNCVGWFSLAIWLVGSTRKWGWFFAAVKKKKKRKKKKHKIVKKKIKKNK